MPGGGSHHRTRFHGSGFAKKRNETFPFCHRFASPSRYRDNGISMSVVMSVTSSLFDGGVCSFIFF